MVSVDQIESTNACMLLIHRAPETKSGGTVYTVFYLLSLNNIILAVESDNEVYSLHLFQ